MNPKPPARKPLSPAKAAGPQLPLFVAPAQQQVSHPRQYRYAYQNNTFHPAKKPAAAPQKMPAAPAYTQVGGQPLPAPKNRLKPRRKKSPLGVILRLGLVTAVGLSMLFLLAQGVLGLLGLGAPLLNQSLAQAFTGVGSTAVVAKPEVPYASLLNQLNQPALLDAGPQTAGWPRLGLPVAPLLPLPQTQQAFELEARLQGLIKQAGPGLGVHLFYLNPQTGQSVSIQGNTPVAAASVIKLPLLLLYLAHQQAGLTGDERLMAMAERHRAGGSGLWLWDAAGTVHPMRDVATKMIQVSDNSATNMMIEALGGQNQVNAELGRLGLQATRVRNPLPDLEGTNTLSPAEMVRVLLNLEASGAFTPQARAEGLSILEGTHNRRLLVAPLPGGVKVAHKTGDIGASVGDSGRVTLPDGRAYYLSVMVERPHNDLRANALIRQISAAVYEFVSREG